MIHITRSKYKKYLELRTLKINFPKKFNGFNMDEKYGFQIAEKHNRVFTLF